ncbi:YheC/YheD family protein [Lentibacillus salicampi]|uniref:YheC/YheD family endospore coat-associated protein n=1 Tax=Lentibacillus salicampi TaxID=175306 RepID=UPI001430D114|nr:YheC/YheD family protein [Lentibacillus salicampi]
MINYNIKISNNTSGTLTINKELSQNFKLTKIKNANIRFGFTIAEVNINIDTHLESNEIILSKGVIKKLGLPTNCQYNIIVKDSEIIIGPFIGIYIGRYKNTVIQKLRFLDSYIQNYNQIKGVVFAFSLDSINKRNLTINGYFYNPNKDRWEEAVLPYPSSIFQRSTFNSEWREYFGALYGNKIFNYRPLNKWEVYDTLNQFPEVSEYLPPTSQYNDIKDLAEYMKQYKDIYLKPISGKKGLGIFNILKDDRKFYVKSRVDGENLEWPFENPDELLNFMHNKLEKGKYIIQKTIDIKFENKVMDFRIGMDKDQLGNWNNLMFVSRVSGENSIVSNRAISGGAIKPISEVLKNDYHMNDQQVEYYKDELVSLAESISNKLELTGYQMGKLAFDFVIDKDKKIWVIEINSRYPDDSLANKIGEKQTYYDIHHTNMLYAKKLGGFEVSANSVQLNFLNEDEQPEDSNQDRFKIFVAIPRKDKHEYENHVFKMLQRFGITGNVDYNEKLRKVEIDINGDSKTMEHFIESIKRGKTHSNKAVIGLKQCK